MATEDETFLSVLGQLDAVKRTIWEHHKSHQAPQTDSQSQLAQINRIEDSLGFIKGIINKSASFMIKDYLEPLTREAHNISAKADELQSTLDKLENQIRNTKQRVKESFPEETQLQSSAMQIDNKGTKKEIQTTLAPPQWLQTLEEKILSSEAPDHLGASYHHLDRQLKLCFLCLAVFPEDHEIKKRVIIYWWIGEGLVSQKGNKPAEQVGEECFAKLVEVGLIEPIYAKASNLVHRCKIHPWFRWMLVKIAKESIFFDFDLQGRPASIISKSRRACLVKSKQPTSVKGENLISLMNVDQNVIRIKGEELSEWRKLVVFQLGRWQTLSRHHIEVDTNLLNGLESLKHLRYLSLRGVSRITEIPESIRQLGDLRILDLRACHNLEKLPVGITYLKKLTHLDVTECYLLDQMPKGLGALSDLQVLKGFVFASVATSHACRFTELTKLENLRKLSLNIGGNAKVNGDLTELTKLKSLRSLTVTWGVLATVAAKGGGDRHTTKAQYSLLRSLTMRVQEPKTTTTKQATTLAALPDLEKLDLRCFPETETPDWLKNGGFDKLKNLSIRGGKLQNLALLEGKWIELEVLRLKFLKELEVSREGLERMFPHLKRAQIKECPNLDRVLPLNEEGVWVRNGKGKEGSTGSRTSDGGGLDGMEGGQKSMAGEASTSSGVGSGDGAGKRAESTKNIGQIRGRRE